MSDKPIDWAKVKAAYCSGVSFRAIESEFGVPRSTVARRAAQLGWVRDLASEIERQTKLKVYATTAEELSGKLGAEAKKIAKVKGEAIQSDKRVEKVARKARKLSEKQIVEANADVTAAVIQAHRTEVADTKGVCLALIAELKAKNLTEEQVMLLAEAHTELMQIDRTTPEGLRRVQKIVEAFLASIDMGARAHVMQKLADSLAKLVALERDAHDIIPPKERAPRDPYKDLTDAQLDEIILALAQREGSIARGASGAPAETPDTPAPPLPSVH